MLAALFLPDPMVLHLELITMEVDYICLTVRTKAPDACCPSCTQPASRVHSRYSRTVADLPCAGRPVRWQLHCRRFFCANTACPRRTFTERLPTVVAPAARRTLRQTTHLQQTGLRAGGEVGAQLLQDGGISVSSTTVLRVVRRTPPLVLPTPRVLGVDDWARRKGQTYGTILCDLETGQPVDLLPDRTAETLAAWLQAHPGIEIISRDRAGAYAEGARVGAPQAQQVADRWHILHNLGTALEEVLIRLYPTLRPALAPGAPPPAPADEDSAGPAGAVPCAAAVPPAGAEPDPVPAAPAEHCAPPRRRDAERSQARRARRLACYEEVCRLQALGWSVSAIARQQGLDRDTVRKWLQQGQFPEHQPRPRRRSQLDAQEGYLRQRWHEGCRNARQLWEELRQRGYRGGYSRVAEWVTRLREEQGLPLRQGASGARRPPPAAPLPGVRQLKWLLLRPAVDLSAEEYDLVRRLCAHSRELTFAYGLVMDFQALVRQRQAGELASWVAVAQASGVPELGSFARGVLRDWAAVFAGLELEWSNGPVEGQVNRLKTLKRVMYGRAKLDLLRLRVLYAH